jgi:phage tail-like protein
MSLLPVQGKSEPLFTGANFVLYLDNEKHAEFSECTLPTLEIGVTDRVEGGLMDYTHATFGARKMGRLTLKKGMTKEKKLLKWYTEALQGNIIKATKEISVVVFDVANQPVAFWFFGKGVPVKWTGPTLKASESTIAIDSLEIVVHDFESVDV